jgi:uncharacterized protein YndB with AHSA1/START domain
MRAKRTRVLPATPQAVWEVLEDPHHFPRWWPGVVRVEAVSRDHWTHVYTTKKGRTVRIDFRLLDSEPPDQAATGPARRSWEQELAGTPFERVLGEAVTEVQLEPGRPSGTLVTIEQLQRLRGYSRTGGWMLRRATNSRLDDALDGLERIFGPAGGS